MENLITVISKLQEIFNETGTAAQFNLPQIVVLGEQSSGKSSVLENVVGRPCLPRGNGIVTRCPIVLQLNQMTPGNESYVKQKAALGVEEWVEFPHLPEGQRVVTDFNKITNIIRGKCLYALPPNAEVNERAGTQKGIVKDELIMKIYSPHVIDLTVVDLPGIVKTPTGGQSEDLPKQIKDLLKSYIKNPNSIILAVCMANVDIANCESLKLAKTVDPNCDRTVAVVTKLDLMDAGTDASDLLTGKLVKVKLGIIGVVNRSFQDIQTNKSIEDSLEDEADFLRTYYPRIVRWNGTSFLKWRLQKILMEHIKSCLPALQSKLTNMKIDAENELEELGGSEPVNKSAVMLNVIEDFCSAFRTTIVGKTREIESRFPLGSAELKVILEVRLANELRSIEPMCDLQNMDILNTISNSSPLESSILCPEAAYQDLVRGQIRRLTGPAMTCTTLVNTQMMNIVQRVMTLFETQMRRFPGLATAIASEVTEILRKRHLVAQDILKTFVEVHASFIKTIQSSFNVENLELIQKSIVSKENNKGEAGDDRDVRTKPRNCDRDAMCPEISRTLPESTSVPRVPARPGSRLNCDPESKFLNLAALSRGSLASRMNLNSTSVHEEDKESDHEDSHNLTEQELEQCLVVRQLVNSYFLIVKAAFQDYCPKAIAFSVIYYMEKELQKLLTAKLYTPDKIEALVKENIVTAEQREKIIQLLKALDSANAAVGEIRDADF